MNSSLSSLAVRYCSTPIDGHDNSNDDEYHPLIIEDDAFTFFPLLHNLSIYDGCWFHNDKKSLFLSKNAFRGLSHLKTLDLSSTGLSEFPGDPLTVLMESLERLDVSNNNLRCTSSANQPQDLRVEYLDISSNPIWYLNLSLSVTNVLSNDMNTDGFFI